MEKDEKIGKIEHRVLGGTMAKKSNGTPLRPSLEGIVVEVPMWYKLPYNPKLKERARALRKAGNRAEILFWKAVKGKQFLGLDFDRQKVIGNYIVDFYCKSLGMIVEVDGKSHEDKADYDRKREEYLTGLGLKMVRFTDDDVKQNIEGVLEVLEMDIRQWVDHKSSAKS